MSECIVYELYIVVLNRLHEQHELLYTPFPSVMIMIKLLYMSECTGYELYGVGGK